MIGLALAQINRLARALMFAGMFVMFFPFGLLVGLGWLLPKAVQVLGPVKDVL